MRFRSGKLQQDWWQVKQGTSVELVDFESVTSPGHVSLSRDTGGMLNFDSCRGPESMELRREDIEHLNSIIKEDMANFPFPDSNSQLPDIFSVQHLLDREKLWNVCKDFIEKQDINCPERIHQSDNVIINAYQLIEDIANIVGYVKINEE